MISSMNHCTKDHGQVDWTRHQRSFRVPIYSTDIVLRAGSSVSKPVQLGKCHILSYYTSNDPVVAHLLYQMLRTKDQNALTIEMKTKGLDLSRDVRYNQNLPLLHSPNQLIIMKMANKAILTTQDRHLRTLAPAVCQVRLHGHHQGRQVQLIRSIQFNSIQCHIS